MNKKEMAKNSTISTRNRQKEAFIKNLKSGVTIKDAAAAAGIDRTTVWLWRKKWKGFDNKVLAVIDSRTQTVEDALFSSAVKGNVAAQIFWLKNRAKDRWKDKFEYDIPGDINVKVNFTE
ncbi:unnamed protein product [marine sediment metagenome]|uniref:Homeodomain phBC6A51-type domain-containing protein n=1 Tax=marine sediment metagenome TaxID=412755 RepID=X1T380_9ZZZZ